MSMILRHIPDRCNFTVLTIIRERLSQRFNCYPLNCDTCGLCDQKDNSAPLMVHGVNWLSIDGTIL